jgi:hypothetical protein
MEDYRAALNMDVPFWQRLRDFPPRWIDGLGRCADDTCAFDV